MASHGIPRISPGEAQSQEARDKELKEINSYQQLVRTVNTKVAEGDFSPELLQNTAELLRRNPEYYTIWNHRRRIYAREFESLDAQVRAGDLNEGDRSSQILQIIQLDLQFLFPLLIKFPKCYWIWNHRLWLLEQASSLLSPSVARPLWEEDLVLVGKMLGRDGRNFMGWGYRRTVIGNLESTTLNGSSLARQEVDYTTKMIRTNLSNFSAWHNRTKLILRILEEEEATDEERKKMLDEELTLIHDALFDPYDQSLWFYHQTLMCTFDPSTAALSMAPNLSIEEKLEYLAEERKFINEVLEEAKDCKWVYQALIESSTIRNRLTGTVSNEERRELSGWLDKLTGLDPLRRGRWADLQKSLIQR